MVLVSLCSRLLWDLEGNKVEKGDAVERERKKRENVKTEIRLWGYTICEKSITPPEICAN